MSETVSSADPGLLHRLRSMRLLLIHPADEDRTRLVMHLKRIGCQTEIAWPAPEVLPKDTDGVLFFLGKLESDKHYAWMAGDEPITRIAIICYETPEILSELGRLNVHGVLSKPIRIFGILAALTTAVGVSRHEHRLKQRIKSLDTTLKARRKIEEAVQILSQSREISEEEAYRRLRDKSMKSGMPISEIAEAIVASSDI